MFISEGGLNETSYDLKVDLPCNELIFYDIDRREVKEKVISKHVANTVVLTGSEDVLSDSFLYSDTYKREILHATLMFYIFLTLSINRKSPDRLLRKK
jgi:hypothetical protein